MLVCYGARNNYRSPSADSRCRQGGFLACLLHISQFLIVDGAGPIASTVVGHAKACLIITIRCSYSRRLLRDGSMIGILLLAVGGIVAFGHAVLTP